MPYTSYIYCYIFRHRAAIIRELLASWLVHLYCNNPRGAETCRSLHMSYVLHHKVQWLDNVLIVRRDRVSSVGIATRHGLDDPGIESRWGRDFLHPSRPALGVHPASYTLVTGSFLGIKLTGPGAYHPPPSSAEVEGRVELYICSPSGPSWPVLGWTLPLPLSPCYRYEWVKVRSAHINSSLRAAAS